LKTRLLEVGNSISVTGEVILTQYTVRDTDFVTAFPAGVTIAASWDRAMCYQRGKGMGAEHFGKGVGESIRHSLRVNTS